MTASEDEMNHSGLFYRLTEYDPHYEARHSPTVPQLALLWIWVISLFLLLVRLTGFSVVRKALSVQSKPTDNGPESIQIEASPEVKEETADVSKQTEEKRFSKVKPPPTFDEFLVNVTQIGVIMLFFYYSDYVKVFPRAARVYSRDTFLFVVFLLFLVGSVFTTKSTADKILNRDMTEEWKGWMQVMFVWYHYFAAAEWYNWIRVYIAAYVWMTGFGNFSFFWVKKDYSLWRAAKMLFRLNFLVLVLCAVVSNPYMLYYICPMHTYWFLSVYAFMAIGKSWNEHRGKMAVKFVIYAVCNAIIFDIPGVTETVFYPLWPVLGLQDGQHSVMHEWSFRLGLDHWMCFVGMLCAYSYPAYEAFIQRIESAAHSRRTELGYKLAVSLPLVVIYAVWHQLVLRPLRKHAYNRYHPYLSFVPVLSFVWFRNLFPWLRTHYIHLFAELGKITLETYLSQLHVYLQSNARELIAYIVGYPLLNLALNTIIYLSISHTLFTLTTNLSAYLIPVDRKQVRWRALATILTLAGAFALAFVSKQYLSLVVPYL